MAKLIITADDSYVEKLKKHLEIEHPSTKGKMRIVIQKKSPFKENLKNTIKNMADSSKKVLKEATAPLDKLDEDLKRAFG